MTTEIEILNNTNTSLQTYKVDVDKAIADLLTSINETEYADNTAKAHKTVMNEYAKFLASNNLSGIDTRSALAFISYLKSARKAINTISQRVYILKSIFNKEIEKTKIDDVAQMENPFDDVLVLKAIKSARKEVKNANKGNFETPKKALYADDLKRLLSNIDVETLTGKRDFALITLDFELANRQSETLALTVDDLEFVNGGINVKVFQKKINEKITKFISKDNYAYQAVTNWLKSAGIESGFIFRRITLGGNTIDKQMSGKAMNDLLKKYADIAGLDADLIASHSLRRGWITNATENDVAPEIGCKHTGQTLSTYLTYIEATNKESAKAVKAVGKLF